MRARPVLAVSASLALLAGAATGPVSAAVGDPADAPAVGAATSSLTLLDVALGGRALSVLELALRSDTLAGAPATSFVVTPLELDGTTYGRQSLQSRSGALPSVDTRALAPAALSALAAVRSPIIDVTSEGGESGATTRSLGAVSVLGLPLATDGTASISSVVDGTAATGTKTLTVENLALPSLADLLAALGLDLTALPTGSLTDLLDRLDLGSTSTEEAIALLEQALAPVQPQLTPAEAVLTEATASVDEAVAELADANAALAPVTKALNDATRALTGATAGATAGLRMGSLLGALPQVPVVSPVVQPIVDPIVSSPIVSDLGPITQPVEDLVDEVGTVVPDADPVIDSVLDQVTGTTQPVLAPVVQPVVEALQPLPALPVTIPSELQPLVDVYDAARAAYDTALADVTDARNLLNTATQLLADAQAAVDALLAPYATQVQAVVDAVIGVLDATPLVALDRLEVTTRSAVTSADAGGQVAEVVGGEVEGLRVLGTDVLDEVVGSSTVEVLDLTSPVTSRLDTAIGGLTGALSDVLSEVPGLPGLEVPAPTVSLLSRATVTEVVDGFGVAGSALRALNVSWPGITVPAVAALPGAASLPAVTGLTSALPGALRTAAVGDVLTQPLSLSIATLEERARFRPGTLTAAPGTGAPTTGTPGAGTPTTGTPGAGTPTTGTPGAGTPTTGTPGTGTPTTGTPGTSNPPTTPVGLTQLPRTGPASATSLLALVLVAAALGLRRRYAAA